jgi:CHASE2 domain-containing sensor protein
MGKTSPARGTLYQRARAYFSIKGLRYWLTAALILLASVLLTSWIPNIVDFSPIKYALFQKLTQFAPRSTKPRYTRLIYIDDDVHRKELGDRIPLRRDYLARIVQALDADDVRLIALDFRLPTVDPAKPTNPGDLAAIGAYRTETDVLMREIARVAQNRKIVLPFMLYVDEKNGTVPVAYRVIQQVYGMCVAPLKDGGWSNPGEPQQGFPLSGDAKTNISCGYINLPGDLRQVPPPTAVRDGIPIDSLSLAIARAIDPEDAAEIDMANRANRTLFASYFSQDRLIPGATVITSKQLLGADQPAMKKLLAHQAVIVGGHWETGLPGSGEFVDMILTPAGKISGALVHQNFAEAILDDRLYSPLANWFLEILFALGSAFVFAAFSNIWTKLGIICAAVAALLLYEWAVFFLFGIFIDAFLPVLGLGLHSIVERLFEPRHELPTVPDLSPNESGVKAV